MPTTIDHMGCILIAEIERLTNLCNMQMYANT